MSLDTKAFLSNDIQQGPLTYTHICMHMHLHTYMNTHTHNPTTQLCRATISPTWGNCLVVVCVTVDFLPSGGHRGSETVTSGPEKQLFDSPNQDSHLPTLNLKLVKWLYPAYLSLVEI